MQDLYDETSDPSSPVSGDVFSTCWGIGTRLFSLHGGLLPPAATDNDRFAFGLSIKINPGQASTLT
jgi:hypothetical protein